MSAQRATAPVRFARFGAAVLMMALAAVIIVRLAGRRGGPAGNSAAPPPPEGQVVDLKERIHQQEFKDGRPVVDIRGASFNRGADGLNRLSGSIEILSLGPTGETKSRLTADEIAYSPGSFLYTVSGQVRVEAEGMVLEGDSFSYDKNRGLFATASDGRFASGKARGEGREISYLESADQVRLGGGFRLEIAPADGKGRATSVSGESLVFDRRERRGRIEGRASIEGAGYRGTSATASFVVTADESALQSADLEGAPKLALTGKDGSGEGSGEVQADRIAVAFSRGPSALAIRTSGPSRCAIRSSADKTETLLAPELVLNVFPDEGRSTWTARGGVRAEIAESGSVGRTLEGGEATLDAAKVLHVTGEPGRAAVADSAEARVEAPKIAVASETGDILASGGVSCVLKKGDGRRTVGFFSPLEDLLVSSERLEIRPKGSVSLFIGDVRVRQGANSLTAGELEIAGEAGRMSGGRGVAATLTEAPAAGKEARTVALGGQDMAYLRDTRTLTLAVKASVRLPDATLEAGTVAVVIDRDTRAVESLSASTDVTVTHGVYVGRSKAAAYEASTRRLTLTGSPVLTDDKGGSARGDKLTFDLPDDKIFIENEGAGRATTVIKS